MRIEGHRGAGFLEPENSIKAFKKAIELGLEGVEFDVSLFHFSPIEFSCLFYGQNSLLFPAFKKREIF